jgi:hypothetical protein
MYLIHTSNAAALLQGRMWEDAFKEMGLPQSSFEKLAFQDGVPKVRSCA